MKLECSTATTPHSHVRSSAATTTMSRSRRRSKGRSNNNPLLMAMATAQGGGSAVKLLSTAHRLPSFSFHPKLVFGNYSYSHNNKMMMMKMGSLGGKESSHLTSSSDDDNDEDEFERDELSSYRGLVLDISYRPINVVCWRRAICLEFLDKADVLEYYDQTVDSPSGSFYIPAVLRVPNLLQVVKRRRIKQNLSRKNIFLRDDYICQYCSSGEHLTVDHLLPISRGGEWTWENLVTACAKCNSRKGHKILEEANMKLIKVPKAPKDFDLIAIPLTNAALRALKRRNALPNEWNQYLGKPSTEP